MMFQTVVTSVQNFVLTPENLMIFGGALLLGGALGITIGVEDKNKQIVLLTRQKEDLEKKLRLRNP